MDSKLRNVTALIVVHLSLILTSCVGRQVPPQIPLSVPEKWQSSLPTVLQNDKTASSIQPWWQQFNDATLNQLVSIVLDQNYSLAVMASKIEQARADRQIASAKLLPELHADASLQRSRLGYQTNNKLFNIFDAGINATWTLDFFGHNRDQSDAMQAQLRVTKFAFKAAEISIVAELIDHYINLRETQLQLQYSQRICELLNTLEKLTQDLHQAGLISMQDVKQVNALVSSQQAQRDLYQSHIKTIIYRLENLCSVMPGHFQALLSPCQPLPTTPTHLLLHTPASVIEHRPDICQAKQLLLVKTSLSAAASSLIYPQINLLALFGLEDTSRTKNTATWSLGGAITMPLLNFGRIEAQIDKAQAEQTEAFILYKKTVLQALYDVEIALAELHHKTNRSNYLQAITEDYSTVAGYTHERFQKGINAFQNVVDAYKLQIQAQSDYVHNQAQQIMAWIALQKAVGASIR